MGTRRQDPIGSGQIHVSYNVTRRIWASYEANYYTGGGGHAFHPGHQTSVGEVDRLNGARATDGAAFNSIGVSYQ